MKTNHSPNNHDTWRVRLVCVVIAWAALWGATHVSAKEIKLGDSCVTSECHGEMQTNEYKHGPVNLGICEPCHIANDGKHAFDPPAEDPRKICFVCHEEEASMPVQHAPFTADCTMCHNPHGGDNRLMLKGGEGAGGCLQCHSDVREGMEFLHGPVGMGDCAACHTPHQSQHAGLLIETGESLCVSCHVDVADEMEGAISVHAPLTDEGCAKCHNPHGGATRFFLDGEGSDLCAKCHGDFLKEIATYEYTHHPMVEDAECQKCHQPHTSNQAHLLEDKLSDLCLSCHNKEIEGSSRSINNIAAEVEAGEFQHGPMQEGNCAACHQGHGSNHPKILQKAFPKNFYAAYKEEAYDLCFNCHNKAIVKAETSEDTDFRNGSQNLHYLHVNREKGRSCRACHHEHASSQPKHVRSEVPFGRWAMKVEFTKTDTGGGCQTGCHLPFDYDRATPVDNTLVEEAATAPKPSSKEPAVDEKTEAKEE